MTDKGFTSDAFPGSVEQRAISPDLFPFDAFEFTKPSAATPTLTLKSAWTLEVANDLNVGNDLLVSGAATVTGDVDANGALDVAGAATLATLEVSGAVTLAGDTEISGALLVSGDAELSAAVDLSGDVDFTGTLARDGDVTCVPSYKTNPTTAWFASKTSWGTPDSFSAGLTVDFSSKVSVGTKAIMIVVGHHTNAGYTYWRRGGDSDISNTPHASSEFANCLISNVTNSDIRLQCKVWLSATYTVDFTTSNASTDLFISEPIEEFK